MWRKIASKSKKSSRKQKQTKRVEWKIARKLKECSGKQPGNENSTAKNSKQMKREWQKIARK